MSYFKQVAAVVAASMTGLLMGPAWPGTAAADGAVGHQYRSTSLGTLGGASSEALAVNERDDVVGWSLTATGEQHAFLWQNGRMLDLGTLGGTAAMAVDVNN